MARTANRLTTKTVESLAKADTKPGLYADGASLYLQVTGKTGRSWLFVYKWRGKRTELGLGSLQDVTLAKARVKLWTIPGMDLKTGRRMKTGKQHRVPLCDRALAILAEKKVLNDPVHVFPGQRPGKTLSTGGMYSVAKRLNVAVTVHGFRSTFKDWARETTSIPNEISEGVLAHEVGNSVERAYARGDAIERRRECLQAWASFCDPSAQLGTVVPIRKSSA